MGASTTFANDILDFFLNGTPIDNLAINATVSPATSLYLSLHVSDPGTSDDQTESESTDGHRVLITRNPSIPAWDVSGGEANPVAQIVWPAEITGETYTHWGIGLNPTGSGKLLLSGAITGTIVVPIGDVPILQTDTSITLS